MSTKRRLTHPAKKVHPARGKQRPGALNCLQPGRLPFPRLTRASAPAAPAPPSAPHAPPGAATTTPAACGWAALTCGGASAQSAITTPACKTTAKTGGKPAVSKAAGRKSHDKPAFGKKSDPRPADPSDTGKRFVPPKQPRRCLEAKLAGRQALAQAPVPSWSISGQEQQGDPPPRHPKSRCRPKSSSAVWRRPRTSLFATTGPNQALTSSP